MRLAELEYDLPEDAVAQAPREPRDEARLLYLFDLLAGARAAIAAGRFEELRVAVSARRHGGPPGAATDTDSGSRLRGGRY